MTPLAFILCFACSPIPQTPGDTTPVPPGVTLPPGEEMLEPAWMYGGHDLRAGPLVREGGGARLTISLRPNWGLKKVTETDTDGDGVYDERYTTEELSPDAKRRLSERRAGPDAPWVVDYDSQGPSSDQLGTASADRACLNGITQRFPQDIGPPSYGNAAVVIPYGGTSPGRCTEAQGAQLARAFACVTKKLDTCLAPLNPGAARLTHLLLDDAKTQAVVSCNFPCSEGAQTKTLRRGSGAIFEAIELPPGLVNASDKTACEYLFHELLHAAGVRQAGDHDTKGNDALYSCARVCSGCSHATGTGVANDHVDCARCASPVENKAQCGLMPEVRVEFVPSPFDQCMNPSLEGAPCKAHKVDVLYCDRTPNTQYLGPLMYCCEKCPDGFTYPGGGNEDRCVNSRGYETAVNGSCGTDEPLWLCNA